MQGIIYNLLDGHGAWERLIAEAHHDDTPWLDAAFVTYAAVMAAKASRALDGPADDREETP